MDNVGKSYVEKLGLDEETLLTSKGLTVVPSSEEKLVETGYELPQIPSPGEKWESKAAVGFFSKQPKHEVSIKGVNSVDGTLMVEIKYLTHAHDPKDGLTIFKPKDPREGQTAFMPLEDFLDRYKFLKPPYKASAAATKEKVEESIPQETVKTIELKKEPFPERGTLYENKEGERIHVEDVKEEKDGEKVVSYTELSPEGNIKNDRRVLQKPIKNFEVVAGVAGMEPIDKIKETHPDYYEAYEKEMAKTEEAFLREFSAYKVMMDKWNYAINRDYERYLSGKEEGEAKKKEGVELKMQFHVLKEEIEKIGTAWNTTNDRFVAGGRQKIALLQELRSLEAKIGENLQQLKKQALEATTEKHGSAEPDTELVAKGHLSILLDQKEAALQKKYDLARAGKISLTADAPKPNAFAAQVNDLLGTINENSTSEDMQRVLDELDALEKRVFAEEKTEDGQENGEIKENLREKRGKRVKRFRKEGEDREAKQPRNQEVSPESLWNEIQSLTQSLQAVAATIPEEASREDTQKEITELFQQTQARYQKLTTGGERETIIKELQEIVRTLKKMLPSPENALRKLSEAFATAVESLQQEIIVQISKASSLAELETIGVANGQAREFFTESHPALQELAKQIMISPQVNGKASEAQAATKLKEVNRNLLGVWEGRARELKKLQKETLAETFAAKVETLKQQFIAQINTAISPKELQSIGVRVTRNNPDTGKEYEAREFFDEHHPDLIELADEIIRSSQGNGKAPGADAIIILKQANNDLLSIWNMKAKELGGKTETAQETGTQPGEENEILLAKAAKVLQVEQIFYKNAGKDAMLVITKISPQEIDIEYRTKPQDSKWKKRKIIPKQITAFLRRLKSDFHWDIETAEVAQAKEIVGVYEKLVESLKGRKTPFRNAEEMLEIVSISDEKIEYKLTKKGSKAIRIENITLKNAANFATYLETNFGWKIEREGSGRTRGRMSRGNQPSRQSRAEGAPAPEPSKERSYEELIELLDSSEIDTLNGIVARSLKVVLQYHRSNGVSKEKAIDEVMGGVDEAIKDFAPYVKDVLPEEWNQVERENFALKLVRQRVEFFMKGK